MSAHLIYPVSLTDLLHRHGLDGTYFANKTVPYIYIYKYTRMYICICIHECADLENVIHTSTHPY